MNVADAPYSTACNALGEIEENAQIRASFERIVLPNAQIFFSSECISDEHKVGFRLLAKMKDTDASANYRGLLVLVCTTFEYFTKQVIQSAVQKMASGAKAYGDLHPKAILANFVYTGQYFSRERDSYAAGSGREIFEKLSEGLVTCKQTSNGFRLNSAMFVEFFGNCTSAQLEKHFSEVGLKEPFGDFLGGYSELKAHFGGGGAREVVKRTRDKLDTLIERRNGLVHSRTISETVTVDELMEASAFMKALMGGLREIVSSA